MYFITCFDEKWLKCLQKWTEGADGDVSVAGRRERLAGLAAHSRCVGYYPSKRGAMDALSRNEPRMEEKSFELCVVEFLPAGVNPVGFEDERFWFRRVGQVQDGESRWVAFSEPQGASRLAGFGMGWPRVVWAMA